MSNVMVKDNLYLKVKIFVNFHLNKKIQYGLLATGLGLILFSFYDGY